MKAKTKRRKLKLNVGLLRKVQRGILAKPERLYMGGWFCGTAACIAGWAIYLAGRGPGKGYSLSALGRKFHRGELDAPLEARKLLGLNTLLADQLFIKSKWPASIRPVYVPNGSREAAQEASDYIDYFIKRHGPSSRKVK